MSVEGRRQRQNVEKVKLDVMPSACPSPCPSPGQSPKRISDENEFELKEEVEESFFEINPDPFDNPSDNNEDREKNLTLKEKCKSVQLKTSALNQDHCKHFIATCVNISHEKLRL